MSDDAPPTDVATDADSTERPRAPEHRIFLIADIRGYTQYTAEHGDEAAAALAKRFAELARQAVESHQGVLLELRGDEALASFYSARQALRGAVLLQQLVATAGLERPVGIGLDTGEAVAVGEGYRGTALNLAARLCAQAGPGHVLATETVVHLAARLEGVDYVNPRTLRLKGFQTPVRVLDIVASDGEPSASRATSRLRGRPTLRRAATPLALLIVGALAVGAFAITRSNAGTSPGPTANTADSASPGAAAPSGAPRASGAPGVLAKAADVAMYKGGFGRTNVMPGPAPNGALVVKWQFRAAADIVTSPIVAGGKVFAGGRDGIVHVIDLATGDEDWSFPTGSAIMTSAAVAENTLYITSSDGVFHAIDLSTHQERWSVTGVSPGSVPTVDGDDAYLGLAAGRFAAVSTADGKERWHVDVSGDASKNAIADGTAYVAGEGSDLVYAIDLASGTIRWKLAMGTARVITPAVADGTVYVVGIDPAGKDSHLAAIDATTGSLRWRYASPTRASLGTLAVSPTVVFTSADSLTGSSLFAVDRKTGTLSWTASLTDGVVFGHPAIVGDHLFVAGATGTLHELDASNGTETSSVAIGGPASAGPIVTGGAVIVATSAGSTAPGGVWAIEGGHGAAASEAPIPFKWLTDLKAPDGEQALYLNVAIDSRGNIYATDRVRNGIVVWDPTGKATTWGKGGHAAGEFDFSEVTLGDQSMSVGFAPDGRIAVGDGGNHRVQLFDSKRRFLRAIGHEGTGRGEFVNPCCVAFDPQGRLYVADPGRNDIQVFDKGGAFIRVIGSSGSGNGQFRRLGVPFIDPATGSIWVPDFGNRRIEVVAPDGTFIATYGDGQDGNPRLAEVNGVVLDKAGRMFVVDTDNFLWVLDPSGRTLWRFGPDLPGAGYVGPSYLLLTGDGKVYLPDAAAGSNRIVVLQLEAPLWPPP
jgi:outer membrane protein assembly factor BamB/class 3 adenylate cyclase